MKKFYKGANNPASGIHTPVSCHSIMCQVNLTDLLLAGTVVGKVGTSSVLAHHLSFQRVTSGHFCASSNISNSVVLAKIFPALALMKQTATRGLPTCKTEGGLQPTAGTRRHKIDSLSQVASRNRTCQQLQSRHERGLFPSQTVPVPPRSKTPRQRTQVEVAWTLDPQRLGQ